MSDCAAAFTVTQYELCVTINADDRIKSICRISGSRDAVSVQTEIERFSIFDSELFASFRIAAQIDVGGVVVTIVNIRCSVPRRPYDICTFSRMVTDVCVRCTTDRVCMCAVICQCSYICHAQRGT